MQHDETFTETEDALHTEVVDGRHLRRDVVVLKVLGHLGKAAAAAEAEDAAGLVDVDDALTTHTEREAALLEERSVTCQYAFAEVSLL